MHAARVLGAAGLVALLAMVAGAPGAAALHDPLNEPLHADVPNPTAVRMILQVVEDTDYSPATEPAQGMIDITLEVADAFAGDSIEQTLAFAELFQDRFDEFRVLTDGIGATTDAAVHACPSGGPVPTIDLSSDGAIELADFDGDAFLRATDPWTAAPGSFADEESTCRIAQAIATGNGAIAELFPGTQG